MMKLVLLTILFLVLMLPACASSLTESKEPEPTSTPKEKAWYACTTFIERQLDLSILDAQRFTASGVMTVQEDQYKVDVHYAKQGMTYRCELSRHANGDWELLSLNETLGP